jgi:hypothetical protein
LGITRSMAFGNQFRARALNRSARGVIALCAALSVAVAAADAQQARTIAGVVLSPDSVPIASARVVVVGTELVATTDAAGRFSIGGVAAGVQFIEVRAVGYGIRFGQAAADTALIQRMAFVLTPVVLSSVDVEAPSAPIVSRGFEERRARGPGKFFDHTDITRMQPRVFTDVLRRVPGLHFQGATGSTVQTQRTQGITGMRPCQLLFYINGAPFPLPPDGTINNFVSADEVVGVEVYTGAAEVPSEFNATMYNARCGVVVVWTRNSNVKRPKK